MIIYSKNFNLRQIADSGQCFRMKNIGSNTFSLIAYGKYIELTQVDNCTIEFNCSEEDYREIWKDYFDMDYDYNEIVESLKSGEDVFLREAAEYGSGMRILQQEPFEALICFIISQNKNIPAITRSVGLLCERFGERNSENSTVYYSFPKPEALANANREEIRKTGLGYRDEYVIKAAQAVYNGCINLTDLKKCNSEIALNKLKSLYGVGDKVANCVLLYGLHHINAYPIDLWIARILEDVYRNKFDWDQYKGYAGIVQQYMFFYIRNKAKEKN